MKIKLPTDIFTNAGYSYSLAKAFVANEITIEQANKMSDFEALDLFLNHIGIIDYTRIILDATECLKSRISIAEEHLV